MYVMEHNQQMVVCCQHGRQLDFHFAVKDGAAVVVCNARAHLGHKTIGNTVTKDRLLYGVNRTAIGR